MTAIERLLEIAGPALGPGLDKALYMAGSERLTAELTDMLSRRDGFFAFEGALHVFPVDAPGLRLDLRRLNEKTTWRSTYWHECDGLLVFAADALGDLFAVWGEQVVRFVTETGVIEPFADSLEDWAQAIITDPAMTTGWPFLRAWDEAGHDELAEGDRLTGVAPFVLGGSFDAANLRAADLYETLLFRAGLASRIHTSATV